MTIKEPQEAPRRIFLKQLGGASGAVALGSVAATGAVLAGSAKEALAAPLVEPGAATYLSLGPDDAAFVEAMVNVMCPADRLTPSGVDCGLAVYIDRQLAGGFGKGDRLYMRAPWKRGKPQLGYQLPLRPEQFFKVGVAAAQETCSKRFGTFGAPTVRPRRRSKPCSAPMPTKPHSRTASASISSIQAQRGPACAPSPSRAKSPKV